MRRVNWGFVALFVAAYSGFLSYYWFTDAHRKPLFAAVAASIHGGGEPLPVRAQSVQNRRLQSSSLDNPRIALAGGAKQAVEQIGPVTALAETGGPSQEAREQVNAVTAKVSNASSPAERAKAIVKLRNLTKTAESVQVLADVLHSDTNTRNRLFAVTALRSLATQGDEDGTVRAALRQAMSDGDPKVASQAQRAYTDIAAKISAAQ